MDFTKEEMETFVKALMSGKVFERQIQVGENEYITVRLDKDCLSSDFGSKQKPSKKKAVKKAPVKSAKKAPVKPNEVCCYSDECPDCKAACECKCVC